MPNVAGPSVRSRRLLMSVLQSKLTYAASIWAPTASTTAKNREVLTQAQRTAAIRITRCYRTVSDMASLVLAKMPPVYLLIAQKARVRDARSSHPDRGLGSIERQEKTSTLTQWQRIWETTDKAAWTRILLPDVVRWYNAPLNAMSYHVAHALTGHGCFEAYLYSRRTAPSLICRYCGLMEDTAEHSLFDCNRWLHERLEVTAVLHRPPRPEDVEGLLCGPRMEDLSEDATRRCHIMEQASRNTTAIIRMFTQIITTKEDDERRRQTLETAAV